MIPWYVQIDEVAFPLCGPKYSVPINRVSIIGGILQLILMCITTAFSFFGVVILSLSFMTQIPLPFQEVVLLLTIILGVVSFLYWCFEAKSSVYRISWILGSIWVEQFTADSPTTLVLKRHPFAKNRRIAVEQLEEQFGSQWIHSDDEWQTFLRRLWLLEMSRLHADRFNAFWLNDGQFHAVLNEKGVNGLVPVSSSSRVLKQKQELQHRSRKYQNVLNANSL